MKTLIGLTGRTGSGKSSAAQIFKDLGAEVIDCDKIAHEALKDAAITDTLKRIFPAEIFRENLVNRKKLGKIVFLDEKKLKMLNSVVHPWVNDRILSLAKSAKSDIVVIDGSELEASGIDEKCAHIIVIEADLSIRLARITQRDNIDRESALMRINAQKDYSKKAVIIKNNSDFASLRLRIESFYKSLTE